MSNYKVVSNSEEKKKLLQFDPSYNDGQMEIKKAI